MIITYFGVLFSFVAGMLLVLGENRPNKIKQKQNDNLPFDFDALINRIESGTITVSNSDTARGVGIVLTGQNFLLEITDCGKVWTDSRECNGRIKIDNVYSYFRIDEALKLRIKSAINNLNKNKTNSIFEEMDIDHSKKVLKSLDTRGINL